MDEQVKGARKVGIYGSHPVISTIGASPREKPEFEVQKIEGFFPGIIGKLDAAPPDVILFDLAAAQPHFAIPLMHTHPTILVIGVELANSKMLVLSGRESCLITAEDLVQAIQATALKSIYQGSGRNIISQIEVRREEFHGASETQHQDKIN